MPNSGAAANELPGALPQEVREERRERLMALQADISREVQKKHVGKTLKVLVDEYDEENDVAVARSEFQAPEIDGVTYIEGKPEVKPGDLVEVVVEDSDDFDLYASLKK